MSGDRDSDRAGDRDSDRAGDRDSDRAGDRDKVDSDGESLGAEQLKARAPSE